MGSYGSGGVNEHRGPRRLAQRAQEVRLEFLLGSVAAAVAHDHGHLAPGAAYTRPLSLSCAISRYH
jgi:hypothetical protein